MTVNEKVHYGTQLPFHCCTIKVQSLPAHMTFDGLLWSKGSPMFSENGISLVVNFLKKSVIIVITSNVLEIVLKTQ